MASSADRVRYIYPSDGDWDEEVPGNVTDVEVASHVTNLPSKTCKDCTLLTHVSLNLGLKVIGENCFNNCRSLGSIIIPSSVEEIRSGAFCDCPALETVDLSKSGVKSIPHACFIRCTNLVKASMPPTVVDIRVNAFFDCKSLEAVDLYKGLTKIGKGAFGNCHNLKTVRVPSSCVLIGKMAFSQCRDLESVEISIVSSELQSIGQYAFSTCRSLKNVALPKNPRCGVNQSAFWQCDQLKQAFGCEGAALNECLRNRFENLPTHAFCYQQVHDSMYDSAGVSKPQANEMKHATHAQDVLGLTPYHILALSSSPSIETFQLLLKQCPSPTDHLLYFDVQGNTALRYAIENKTSDTTAFTKAILHVLVDRRVESLGLESWRATIVQKLNNLFEDDVIEEREGRINSLFAILHLHERKESTSLLDHAVWKHRVTQSENEQDSEGEARETKRIKTDMEVDSNVDDGDRQSSYLNSGAETVIANVLPYLGPIPKTIKF